MHTENRFSAVTVTADLWAVSVGRVLNVLNVSANWSLPMQKVQVHTFLTRTVHTRYETLGSVLPFLFHDLFHFLFAHRVSNGPSFCSDGDILLFMILNKTGKKVLSSPNLGDKRRQYVWERIMFLFYFCTATSFCTWVKRKLFPVTVIHLHLTAFVVISH